MESAKQRAIDKLYSVEKNHCGLLCDSPYRTIFAGDEDGVGDNAVSIFECFRKDNTEKTRPLHREICLNVEIKLDHKIDALRVLDGEAGIEAFSRSHLRLVEAEY